LGARKDLANQNRRYRLERLADAWRSIGDACADGIVEVLEALCAEVRQEMRMKGRVPPLAPAPARAKVRAVVVRRETARAAA
jgi:hypothetical protein